MSAPAPWKRCPGPAHSTPVLLPVTVEHWYFNHSGRRAGLPVSRCKQCVHWYYARRRGGARGWVEAELVVHFLLELIARCGSEEKVERAHGIGRSTQGKLLRTSQVYVQRRTAARILSALATQRRLDRKYGTSKRFHSMLTTRAHNIAVLEGNPRAEWHLSH